MFDEFSIGLADLRNYVLWELEITYVMGFQLCEYDVTGFMNNIDRRAIASLLYQFRKELKDYEPTVNLFSYFFQPSIISDDFVTFKKRAAKDPKDSRVIFTSNTSLKWIDPWNEGWMYIPNYDNIPSLKGFFRNDIF